MLIPPCWGVRAPAHTPVRVPRGHPPARSCFWLQAWLALGLALLVNRTAVAQFHELLGSPQSRQQAIQAMPLDELSDTARARLERVVSRPTIYRHMPAQVIESDPDLHVFLVRHPEVVVGIWQLMDITRVQLRRTGPFRFEAEDGVGTVSQVELVYGRHDLHIYYAQGYYEGPLFGGRIPGECVLVLRSQFSTRDHRDYVSNQMDFFLRTDHPGADILLKTLHPLLGKAADYNFVETAKFLSQVSRASQTNGPGMERMAGQLPNVEPAVQRTFAQYTDVVYQRALMRQPSRAIPPSATASTAVREEGE